MLGEKHISGIMRENLRIWLHQLLIKLKHGQLDSSQYHKTASKTRA